MIRKVPMPSQGRPPNMCLVDRDRKNVKGAPVRARTVGARGNEVLTFQIREPERELRSKLLFGGVSWSRHRNVNVARHHRWQGVVTGTPDKFLHNPVPILWG